MKIYLSGSMEDAPDGGVGWRAEITPKLKELGYEVADPAAHNSKKIFGMSTDEFNYLKVSNTDEYKEIVRKNLITVDALDILSSDLFLIFYDKYGLRSGGSISESFLAYLCGIPIIMVTEMEISEISGWFLSEVSRQFDSFERMFLFLSSDRMVTDLIERTKVSARLDPMLKAVFNKAQELLETK